MTVLTFWSEMQWAEKGSPVDNFVLRALNFVLRALNFVLRALNFVLRALKC